MLSLHIRSILTVLMKWDSLCTSRYSKNSILFLEYLEVHGLTNASGTGSSVLWALSPRHWIQIYSFHPRMFEAGSQKSTSWGKRHRTLLLNRLNFPSHSLQATRTRRPITPNSSDWGTRGGLATQRRGATPTRRKRTSRWGDSFYMMRDSDLDFLLLTLNINPPWPFHFVQR